MNPVRTGKIRGSEIMIELNIVENPNKWAIPESVESLTDTDDNINLLIDKLIERNMGAWKLLSKL